LGLRLFSFGGYGLALAALALVVFGAIECLPNKTKSGRIRNFRFPNFAGQPNEEKALILS